ncbi:MAG: hypothetical protein ACJAS4_000491 [Bacteriovoracaceae bacterium]|jgi:hypothetical protein
MTDEKLKTLLQSDLSLPSKPTNEWNQILVKIEKRKIKWKLYIPSFAILIILIVGGFQGHSYYQVQEEKQLAEFLIDSSEYFNEQDQYYAWMQY